jgi:hypothetical protein
MDPLTIEGGDGGYGVLLLILILWSLAVAVRARGADASGRAENGRERSMRTFLLRIRDDELLVLRCLSIVGVPILMVVLSVGVPVLRNPLFLGIGVLVGFFLPGFWLSASTVGKTALVTGLILTVVYCVLVLMLQST